MRTAKKTMSGDVSAKYHSKVVLLGNSGVGKTQFMTAIFDDASRELRALPTRDVSTIGVDFRRTTRITRDDTAVKLLIWDTAGQERFASLMPNYTRESEAIILLYDVTDKASFDDLERRWRPIIDDHLDSVGRANVICYLVANKIDLDEARVIDQSEGRAYANGRHMIYAETTVLRRSTVHTIVDDLANRLASMHNAAESSGRARRTVPNNTTTVVVNNTANSRRCCA